VETLVAQRTVRTPSQPIPRRTNPTVRAIGELRLPLAGPYRPWARLYLYPDGRLLWRIRLWEVWGPVAHLVRTETLRSFARANRLPALLAEVERLYASGRAEAARDGAC
jgi:hypothetical protein